MNSEAIVPFFDHNKLSKAFHLACELHHSQIRKGSNTPYIGHLLNTCAIVIENDGSIEQACAALLHDAVEDQGGLDTVEMIRFSFGDSVADIVLACSDSTSTPKPPWRERKEKYLAHMGSAPSNALLVSLADKLHNIRSIIRDHNELGSDIWSRFKGKEEGTKWYYSELSNKFQQLYSCPLTDEFSSNVEILMTLD